MVSPAIAKNFNSESFTLNNGMQVVVIPNHRAPVVTHMIWYKVGGADEPVAKSGITHFLEHLMFKGTKKTPDGEFSTTVKKLGGNDNAFTSHDYTAYYQNIPKEHLEKMISMEADRMHNLTLSEEDVAHEREVIIEERGQRIDNNPQAKFQEQLMHAIYMNHPYGTPVIGWRHEIKSLKREDALNSYKKWYSPNNAILIVSGDITAKELRPLVEKHYGTIENTITDLKRIRPTPAPNPTHKRLIMQDKKVGQPLLAKLYRAPRGSNALELGSEIFGGGATSKLYKSLVIEQKLAISINVDYDPITLNDSIFTIYTTPTPGTSLTKLEGAINAEIKKIIDSGTTKTELKNAKKKKLGKLNYYLDSLQGPALLFGRHLVNGFSADYIENTSNRISNIELHDVNKSIRSVFAKNNIPVTGILLPENYKDKK